MWLFKGKRQLYYKGKERLPSIFIFYTMSEATEAICMQFWRKRYWNLSLCYVEDNSNWETFRNKDINGVKNWRSTHKHRLHTDTHVDTQTHEHTHTHKHIYTICTYMSTNIYIYIYIICMHTWAHQQIHVDWVNIGCLILKNWKLCSLWTLKCI